jgi:cytochrome c5
MHKLVKALLVLFLLPLASACSTPQNAGQSFSNTSIEQSVMAKWSRSCALCHVDGVADAPLVGDTSEWQRRLAKGEQAVLRNVLEGVNSMPPLGYCMACEIDDFRAMIAFMVGDSR